MTAEMAGEFKKGNILFPNRIENSDGTLSRSGEADNDASGAAELALQRLNVLRRRLKVVREEVFENFHGDLRGLLTMLRQR